MCPYPMVFWRHDAEPMKKYPKPVRTDISSSRRHRPAGIESRQHDVALTDCKGKQMGRRRSRPAIALYAVLIVLLKTGVSADNQFDKAKSKVSWENQILSGSPEKHPLNSRGRGSKDHQRSRQMVNFGEDFFDSDSGRAHVDFCRCEYPGEEVYGESDGDNYILDDVMILPKSHPGCQNVLFVCPGEAIYGSAWSYECPSDDQGGERRRAKLRGHRVLEAYKQPQYTVDDVSENAGETRMQRFSTSAHHLIDEDTGDSRNAGSPAVSYVVLPENDAACIQGGTTLSSHSIPVRECKSINLNFEKAEDGRPLAGGTFVANEWSHKSGVSITALSHDGPQDVHPMIFDSEDVGSNGLDSEGISFLGSPNTACGGAGVGQGGEVGSPGENCGFLGNVLIPSRRAGSPLRDSEFGILIFEFNEDTEVNAISLLNIMDTESHLQIIQGDGSTTNVALSSVGQNGFQTVPVNLESVTKLYVSLKSFAAVVDLDLCIAIPSSD